MITRSFIRQFLSACTAAAAMLCLLPYAASAAESYAVAQIAPCYGSIAAGQHDFVEGAGGKLYYACEGAIHVYTTAGVELPSIPVIGGASDVAPSPNGEFLFYVDGAGAVRKLARQQDGTYVPVQGFSLVFTVGGITQPAKGLYLASDAWGDIYVQTGVTLDTFDWTSPGVSFAVVKYDGATGKQKAIFGIYGDQPGQLNRNMGIGVTRDGRSAYTIEQESGRVQRWDFGPDGEYHQAAVWTGAGASCDNSSPGGVSRAGDVTVDVWGAVYLADPACGRYVKFTKDGQFLWTQIHTTGPWGIAVNGNGDIYDGQYGYRWDRTSPVPAWPAITPLPPGDREAPTVTNLSVPGTSTVQNVAVGISATDNVGVSQMRFGNEKDVYGAWMPYNTNASATLSDGCGSKLVLAQVRDAVGRQSAAVSRAVNVPCIDTTAPVVTSVSAPATTTVQGITINLAATDNVGTTQMRFANEDGIWGAWKAFATSTTHDLLVGYGTKLVSAQVRDAAQNESQIVHITLTWLAPAPPVDGGGDGGGDPVQVGATPGGTTGSTATTGATTTTTSTTTSTTGTTTGSTSTTGATPPAGGVPPGGCVTQAECDAAGQCIDQALCVPAGGTPPLTGDGGSIAGTNTHTTTTKTVYVGGGGNAAGNSRFPRVVIKAKKVNTRPTVKLRIVATDDIGVTNMRIKVGAGKWSKWGTFAASRRVKLRGAMGPKIIKVQVRDSDGHVSAIAAKKIWYVLA